MASVHKKPPFFALYSDEAFSAEVEKGNITPDDIDKLNALSERTRLYRNIGLYGGAGAAAWYARFNRKPPWSFPKTAFFATVGSIGGLALSSVAVAASLYRSFEGFQDNQRFKQAIDNLRAGRAAAQGVLVPKAPHRSQGTDAEAGSTSWAQSTGDGTTYDAPPEGQHVVAQNSRWADIRAANNTAKTSTWDRIREQRSKADSPSSSPSSPPSTTQSTTANPFFSGIPVPPTPTPRKPTSSAPAKKLGAGIEGKLDSGGEAPDKEAFDALLEAERNFGQDQDKKPQSRWS